jgi:hypothetical protein
MRNSVSAATACAQTAENWTNVGLKNSEHIAKI